MAVDPSVGLSRVLLGDEGWPLAIREVEDREVEYGGLPMETEYMVKRSLGDGPEKVSPVG